MEKLLEKEQFVTCEFGSDSLKGLFRILEQHFIE
jgi:hypothetical protein